MREQVTIGFGVTSDWLRKWREFFKPITERSNAKPKQMQITFDTQVKTALTFSAFRLSSMNYFLHETLCLRTLPIVILSVKKIIQ